MILITGATGHLGKAVIDQLLTITGSEQITAFVRDRKKAAGLEAAGIKLAVGSFDDTASLDAAMQGIDKVLLISTVDPERARQHRNVVDAAGKAGVKYIAYTGVSMTDLEQSAGRQLMESHFQTEDHIRQSGLAHGFFRNTLYLDYIPVFVGEHVLQTGVNYPSGDGKVPFAMRQEMGEAIANVLASGNTENRTYEITNTELYSFRDVANLLTEISGITVGYHSPDAAAFVEQLKGFGVPEANARMAANFAVDIAEHRYEQTGTDLEQLLGRKPTTLREGLLKLYKF